MLVCGLADLIYVYVASRFVNNVYVIDVIQEFVYLVLVNINKYFEHFII